MHPFPHRYVVEALDVDAPDAAGGVRVTAAGLLPLTTAAPAEFGGPGDRWSPETLLVAAAADCFILTFRAVARASKLSWTSLSCTAEGTLDRVDNVTRFTALKLHARLVLPAAGEVERARRLLEKSEKSCLVTNSLALTPALTAEVEVGARGEPHAA